jgi:aldose 1-epimerase
MNNIPVYAGFSVDGEDVELYTLSTGGIKLTVTNLGAAATSLHLPESDDVILGFHDLHEQLLRGPMFGATLGRCAGKILGASYELNGSVVELSKSHGMDHAHGGIRGFDKHVFKTKEWTENMVHFFRVSPDGEEGYPGNLQVDVIYEVTDFQTIKIRYRTLCDKDSLVCISNHIYWNLRGNGSRGADEHLVQIQASRVGGLDQDGRPDGTLTVLSGTPMDFQMPGTPKSRLEESCSLMRNAGGFDHDYLLNKKTPAAVVTEPITGRSLSVNTDMPCLHFYLANFQNMNYPGKDGARYSDYCGLCFEPGYISDSIHSGNGPIPILRANIIENHETVF